MNPERPIVTEKTLVASGRTADVYAIDNTTVVKLLKPGFPAHLLVEEELRATLVHSAGVPSPEVRGSVEIDNRAGLLFEHIDTYSMLDAAFAEPGKALDFAPQLAQLHAAILNNQVSGLPAIKDILAERIDGAELPLAQRSAAKDTLLRLPEGDAVLHGDFHPGNVMIANDGPKVIDWGDSASGHPAADIARTLMLITPASASSVSEVTSDVERLIIEFAGIYRTLCLELTGLTDQDVAAWRLPVIAARLTEGIDAEHKIFLTEIATLTS